MLSVENISFSYRNKKILDDITFNIEPGEIVGLSGVSGRGKTTLAKIIAGYIKPDQGRVLVDGSSIDTFRGIRPVQLIFQHPEAALDPKFKISKSLNEGWETDQYTKDLFGIEDEWLSRYPSQLSGGQIQRICLARALDYKVRYVVADEITTMLDPIAQVQIYEALLEVSAARNIGILAISHNDELLERICSRKIKL